MVGRTAGPEAGGKGERVCVWEGPQEVAAEAGDDNGIYMRAKAGKGGRAFDLRLCVCVWMLYDMVEGAEAEGMTAVMSCRLTWLMPLMLLCCLQSVPS